MTTHDDSNREGLERDLSQLAKPRETDDAFRLSLRAALLDQLQPPVEAPRWKRPLFRFAFAGGAAAVVVAGVVLALGTAVRAVPPSSRERSFDTRFRPSHHRRAASCR